MLVRHTICVHATSCTEHKLGTFMFFRYKSDNVQEYDKRPTKNNPVLRRNRITVSKPITKENGQQLNKIGSKLKSHYASKYLTYFSVNSVVSSFRALKYKFSQSSTTSEQQASEPLNYVDDVNESNHRPTLPGSQTPLQMNKNLHIECIQCIESTKMDQDCMKSSIGGSTTSSSTKPTQVTVDNMEDNINVCLDGSKVATSENIHSKCDTNLASESSSKMVFPDTCKERTTNKQLEHTLETKIGRRSQYKKESVEMSEFEKSSNHIKMLRAENLRTKNTKSESSKSVRNTVAPKDISQLQDEQCEEVFNNKSGMVESYSQYDSLVVPSKEAKVQPMYERLRIGFIDRPVNSFLSFYGMVSEEEVIVNKDKLDKSDSTTTHTNTKNVKETSDKSNSLLITKESTHDCNAKTGTATAVNCDTRVNIVNNENKAKSIENVYDSIASNEKENIKCIDTKQKGLTSLTDLVDQMPQENVTEEKAPESAGETNKLSSVQRQVKNEKHSQYDELKVPEPAKKQTILSILRTQLVDRPMNSFLSLYGQPVMEHIVHDNISETLASNVYEKQNVTVKAQKACAKVEKPTKTALDGIYTYIPYLFKLPLTANQEKAVSPVQLKDKKSELTHQVNINNRTRLLVRNMSEATRLYDLNHAVESLKDHLLKHPETRLTAIKANAIKEMTHIYRTTYDKDLRPSLRMSLAMLGAVDPPKRRGLRILALDGGGCRGAVSVEVFRRLVELSGKPIHEMFDYICGTSTGALLCFLIGIKKISIDDLVPLYRTLTTEIFYQHKLVGASKLVWTHAYYNTNTYQSMLQRLFGDQILIETAADETIPKCSAVSVLVNRLAIKPFVWRNYSVVQGTKHAHWPGTCRGALWEAARASSAAPGYFEEFRKGNNIHQDGAMLTNNPSGVALNEARMLWPDSPIQCVVSIGTGRYEPTVGPTSNTFLSLKDKLLKLVDGATNVSSVHTVLYDLLPPGTYFRFDPFIREPLLLDDYQPEKLDLLVSDALKYIERNDHKFRVCVDTLLR